MLAEIGFGGRFPDPPLLGTLFTADLPNIPSQVPNWAATHVLICASPASLVSPQESVEWTVSLFYFLPLSSSQIDEYVSWCDSHTDLERMTFLNTLLTSYSSSVVAKGELEYVPFYPHLTQIINQSMQL